MKPHQKKVKSLVQDGLNTMRITPKPLALGIPIELPDEGSGLYRVQVDTIVSQTTFEKHLSNAGLIYLGSGWSNDQYYVSVRVR